jgi:hypothetical protein
MTRRTTALPSTVAGQVNRVVAWLADHGFTPANTVTLEVPGRRTGLPRKTVVVLAFHQDGRFPQHPSIEALAERAVCYPVFRLHPDR